MAKKTLTERHLDNADACVKAGRLREAFDHLERAVAIQAKQTWSLHARLAKTLGRMGVSTTKVH